MKVRAVHPWEEWVERSVFRASVKCLDQVQSRNCAGEKAFW